MAQGGQEISRRARHRVEWAFTTWVVTPLAALGAVLLALFDHEDEPEDHGDP